METVTIQNSRSKRLRIVFRNGVEKLLEKLNSPSGSYLGDRGKWAIVSDAELASQAAAGTGAGQRKGQVAK